MTGPVRRVMPTVILGKDDPWPGLTGPIQSIFALRLQYGEFKDLVAEGMSEEEARKVVLAKYENGGPQQ